MARVMDGFHHLSEPHVHRQGHHPRPRNHDLTDLGIAQREDPFEDVALVREETRDPAGFDQGFQLPGREHRHQGIPLGRQSCQPQQKCRQRFQDIDQRGQTAHHRLQDRSQPQCRRLGTIEHPGLRQETGNERRAQNDCQKQPRIQPDSAGSSVRPEPHAESTTSPAERDDGESRSQLGHHQSPFEVTLQALNSCRAAQPFLHQHLNAATITDGCTDPASNTGSQ